ncbi:hypothetical protein [Candidatus Puniceispirillum sp.]|uniref:hypothetical protein n=1 Tax=Candidatus Puniceispirillum sp. TaxID=2026719 RepID=UPI003F6A3CC9
MKGWMIITHDGIAEDKDLQGYVNLAVFFSGGLQPKFKAKKPHKRRSHTQKPYK